MRRCCSHSYAVRAFFWLGSAYFPGASIWGRNTHRVPEQNFYYSVTYFEVFFKMHTLIFLLLSQTLLHEGSLLFPEGHEHSSEMKTSQLTHNCSVVVVRALLQCEADVRTLRNAWLKHYRDAKSGTDTVYVHHINRLLEFWPHAVVFFCLDDDGPKHGFPPD